MLYLIVAAFPGMCPKDKLRVVGLVWGCAGQGHLSQECRIGALEAHMENGVGEVLSLSLSVCLSVSLSLSLSLSAKRLGEILAPLLQAVCACSRQTLNPGP